MQLERCRHDLDEAQQRSKQDRSEKDVKMMLLENEVDRVRSTVTSKNEQLEELMEQRQKDRSHVLELKEQLSQLLSDLTTAQADLEHEQAHRKRLELRLRSFMTTPELNNTATTSTLGDSQKQQQLAYHSSSGSGDRIDYDNLESNSMGMYRDRDNTFSVRPSSMNSNNNNNNNNYQANNNNKMSMGRMEEYYDNSDSNTVQSANTRVLPYNSSNSNSSAVDYSTYSKDTMMSTINQTSSINYASKGIDLYIHDDESDYHAHQLPSSQLQQSSSSSLSQSLSATPKADHRMTQHSYSESSSSPALDRVSAALAARAVADSSSSTGGTDRSSSLSIRASTDSKSALRLAQQHRNVGRHPNSTITGISLISDPNALSYDTSDDSSSIAAYHNNHYSSNSNTNNSTGDNSVGMSAEETIRRTQMVLNKRMGLNANTTAASMGSSKGASTLKLAETIHHAHAMYPPSPVTSRGSSIHERDGGMIDIPVPAPQLQPISPPIVRHGVDGTSMAVGDDDMSSDYMVEYFNSNSPSGMIISNVSSSVVSTAVASTSASALSSDKRSTSASKKKKSTASSSSSKQNQIVVETGRNYGGLEDALQLPKINHLSHGKKK